MRFSTDHRLRGEHERFSPSVADRLVGQATVVTVGDVLYNATVVQAVASEDRRTLTYTLDVPDLQPRVIGEWGPLDHGTDRAD